MVSNFRMASNKPPLVLLHPLAMSGNAWREVGPLVSSFHELYVPTAVGHRGGLSVQRRPATMTDMVDAAQRYLDECGLDRPHVAGNSMGGFVAIELARRGRAATVCAFSPVGLLAGGGWFSEASIQQAAARRRARSFLTSSPAPPLQVRNVASAHLARHGLPCRSNFSRPGPRVHRRRRRVHSSRRPPCRGVAHREARPAAMPHHHCVTIACGRGRHWCPPRRRAKIERIPQAAIKPCPTSVTSRWLTTLDWWLAQS